MKAKPPGWRAPRLRTRPYAIETRQRRRGEIPLKDEVARARAGILFSAAAAWHPPWLKWRVSLGETHRPDSPIPPAQTRSGEVLQASKHLGFALRQGNQCRTLAGEILKAAERLRAALTLATASSHTALKAHRLREAATAPDRE